MVKLLFQDPDQSLINFLVEKRDKNRDMCLRMLSLNMVPITWFCYLATISRSQVTVLTNPADPILTVCWPFPQTMGDSFENESGPRFILLNDAAINYITNPKHGHRRFNSKK